MDEYRVDGLMVAAGYAHKALIMSSHTRRNNIGFLSSFLTLIN